MLPGSTIDFSVVFDAARSGMAVTEEGTGVVLTVNNSLLCSTGLARENLLGRSLFESGLWAHESERQACLAEFSEKACVGAFQAGIVVQSGEFPHLISARPIDMGGTRRMLWEFCDLSARPFQTEVTRQLHAELTATLQAIPDLLFELNEAGEYINVWARNPDLLAAQKDKLLGHTVNEMLPAEAASVVMSALREAGKSGYSEGQIFSLELPQGTSWFELSTSVKESGGGAARRFIMLSRDVTARMRAEEALSRSQALLRVTLDSTEEGMLVVDAKGGILAANRRFQELWRIPRELMSADRDDELIAYVLEQLQDPDEFVREVKRLYGGTESSFDNLIFKDGRFFERYSVAMTYSGQQARLWAFRDVTARKHAEAELEQHRLHLEELVQQRTAALAQTEAKASYILQTSADGLYGIDAEGVITFINPAACNLLGYAAEDVVGKPAHTVLHHSRQDGSPYPAEECPSHSTLKTGQQVRVDNEVYWHANGSPVPVMYATHAMIQDGKIMGAVTSFVDMRQQRAAAEAREQAVIAAEHLARVRSEFLANMSHEIRTPLNGVLGFAAIGARNHEDPERVRNAFEKILASGKRLLGVINDILDFSKMEVGKMNVLRTQVSLSEVIEHSMEVVRERAAAKHIDLRVQRAPDLPRTCVGDPLRMEQVLLNLLSNAVKFTDRGSVTLAVSRAERRLVFAVTDTGIGMSEEDLRLLFRPFEQLDGSPTRRFGGTGLGLAISKNMAELMGGDIRVRSQPGRGSTFEFSLPCVEFATDAAEPSPAQADPVSGLHKPLEGMTILVAEDDEINMAILEETLIEAGASVITTRNGREAVERVSSDGARAYDVVLMDVQMPEMDGYEATRLIRQLAPALPVIGQTAHALPEEKAKCLDAGMLDHIPKPTDAVTLVKVVRRHVVAKRAG